VLKHFVLKITGVNDYEQAQVCAGGVPLTEIDTRTCASRKQPGLYLTGELLDVNGDCGGYNLQWAFTTGILAGRAAAEEQ
jgi:predicted flavoprotein YhiN